jgi:hypothetical protein
MKKLKERFIYDSLDGLRVVRQGVTNQNNELSKHQAVSKVDTVTPQFSIEEDEE